MKRFGWLAGVIAMAVLMWAVAAIQQSKGATIPAQYDAQIQAATGKFWPDLPDFKLWKAQLYQESRLDPVARSEVGAEGLAQFMGPTWQDISRALGYGLVSRTLAGPAIEGGAYYMAKLRRVWNGRGRDAMGRHALAEAAYNAGIGSVLQAQAKCADAIQWPAIAPCMAFVTGTQNARQTIDYVEKIAMWRKLLK